MNKEKEDSNLVYSFTQIKDILGDSDQGKYLFRYLSELDAKTCVLENNYVDKDYLIDYSNFYARSFSNLNRFTKRLHIFSQSFSKEEFKDVLTNIDEKILKKLEDSYLGFVVIKPIDDSRGNPLIGRTILRTYSTAIKGTDNIDERRFYITGSYSVSFFGIPLKIESLPFQSQDTAVGACATAACWISLHPLSELFGIEKYSPFEVTERSVSFPSLERNFPSTGLTLFQIKTYFNSIGLETEFIDIKKNQKENGYQYDIVADAVRAYTKMGLPIIAALALKKENGEDDYDLHATVISGYRHKHGVLTELYVHDDQIGPYSKVIPDGNFSAWKNEWIKNGYSNVFVTKLVVPIYPKIRLSFGRIYDIFLKHKRKLDQLIQSKIIDEKLSCFLYLMDVRQYKKFIWKHNCERKDEILCKPFPRFLWVVRYNFHGIPIMDYVYDGTTIFPKEFCLITFKN